MPEKMGKLDPFAVTKQLITIMTCMGAKLTTGCYYKVVRVRSDRGSRYTDKDQSEETKD